MAMPSFSASQTRISTQVSSKQFQRHQNYAKREESAIVSSSFSKRQRRRVIPRRRIAEARSLNTVRMQANHWSGKSTCISDEILLFGSGRRTTCRVGNFRGRLMAPLCKTRCNYMQLLELSFSSLQPPPSLDLLPHLSPCPVDPSSSPSSPLFPCTAAEKNLL